jgi:hypothetical protein
MTTSVKSNLVNNNYRPNINNINGGGRPAGSRTRLSQKLITDLSEIWHEHGPDVLRKMALRDPIALARMAYSTLPKDILVSVEQKTIPGGLEPDDWAMLVRVLDTIKGAVPPESNAPPAEVFGVIETALRAHFARQIEA